MTTSLNTVSAFSAPVCLGGLCAASAAEVSSSADTDTADGDKSIRAMQEIVVQGQRSTQALARMAEKDAENIVNVMT